MWVHSILNHGRVTQVTGLYKDGVCLQGYLPVFSGLKTLHPPKILLAAQWHTAAFLISVPPLPEKYDVKKKNVKMIKC
jgi:hypothetical protein